MHYLLFHKPYGVVSQFSGEEPNLRTYIPIKDVYPVGRLDKDSEGLMLLTDDGSLQHRFTDPKFEHPRTYWAQLEGVPDQQSLNRLRQGVTIQGYQTRPAQVRILDPRPDVAPRDPPIRVRKSIPDTWIELTLIEGRNRQVRHMTAEVGHPTLRLIRVAIGNLRLAALPAGKWQAIPNP